MSLPLLSLVADVALSQERGAGGRRAVAGGHCAQGGVGSVADAAMQSADAVPFHCDTSPCVPGGPSQGASLFSLPVLRAYFDPRLRWTTVFIGSVGRVDSRVSVVKDVSLLPANQPKTGQTREFVTGAWLLRPGCDGATGAGRNPHAGPDGLRLQIRASASQSRAVQALSEQN